MVLTVKVPAHRLQPSHAQSCSHVASCASGQATAASSRCSAVARSQSSSVLGVHAAHGAGPAASQLPSRASLLRFKRIDANGSRPPRGTTESFERARTRATKKNNGASQKNAIPHASSTREAVASATKVTATGKAEQPQTAETGNDVSDRAVGAGSQSGRWELSMQEYRELKVELTRTTGLITGLGTAYCFLGYSLQAALSFAFGCIFSVVYIQELCKAADATSKEAVPPQFQQKRPRQRRLSSISLVESVKKVLAGMQLSLSSPRLLLPAVMVLVWAASREASGGDPTQSHLEFAPMLLGFFSYKAAVLYITFRKQVDLLH